MTLLIFMSVHIQALHDKLKEKNIWLWKLGAIEPYLGLDSKSEGAWSGVKQVIDDNGVSSIIKDDELIEVLEWLCGITRYFNYVYIT